MPVFHNSHLHFISWLQTHEDLHQAGADAGNLANVSLRRTAETTGVSVVASARGDSWRRATPPTASLMLRHCSNRSNIFFFSFLKELVCALWRKEHSPWPLLAEGRSDLGHLGIQSSHDHGLDQLLVIWANGANKAKDVAASNLESFESPLTWVDVRRGVFGIGAADKACVHQMFGKLTLHVVQHL